ncbi:hypothetical protein FOA52_001468 [Chlamydomonas sp. UWO 241]|nr:hypothetical protein FOA52_001468 [Chlamydomonas sp. UWO 241]
MATDSSPLPHMGDDERSRALELLAMVEHGAAGGSGALAAPGSAACGSEELTGVMMGQARAMAAQAMGARRGLPLHVKRRQMQQACACVMRTGASICFELPPDLCFDGVDGRQLEAMEWEHIAHSIVEREAAAVREALARDLHTAVNSTRPAQQAAARRRTATISAGVMQWHAEAEAEARRRREEAARQRIHALKSADMGAYLKLVKDANSERFQAILGQTDACLRKLCAKLGIAAASGGVLDSSNAWGRLVDTMPADIPEQPVMVEAGALREYQMHGLRWLVGLHAKKLNGCLADEMGLGKTIQVIAMLCHLVEVQHLRGRFLIVAPASVLPNWAAELARWAPRLRVTVYHGNAAERARAFDKAAAKRGQGIQVLLTTYDMCIGKNDSPRLSRLTYEVLIVDEGHRLKNADCKLSTELQMYKAGCKVLLTGTPLQNNLRELWSLMHFLMPDLFGSADEFEGWFAAPLEALQVSCSGGGSDGQSAAEAEAAALNQEEYLLVTSRLHAVLRPFMLRRLKAAVATELPSKFERTLSCAMSPYQSALTVLAGKEPAGADAPASKQAAMRSVNNMAMEMRNICNHPYISHLHVQHSELGLPHADLPPVITLCGKLDMLDRVLTKLQAGGHKVLLFCTMTRMLDVIEELLHWHGHRFLRLDGSTPLSERGELVAEFNNPASNTFVFLLSMRAGGVGINLQAADTVIFYDSDWNPAVEDQAMARAYRIGQARTVLVLRLVTAGSIEEHIVKSAGEKRKFAEAAITGGFFDNSTSAEDRREYLVSLITQTQTNASVVAESMTDDALVAILDRSGPTVETPAVAGGGGSGADGVAANGGGGGSSATDVPAGGGGSEGGPDGGGSGCGGEEVQADVGSSGRTEGVSAGGRGGGLTEGVPAKRDGSGGGSGGTGVAAGGDGDSGPTEGVSADGRGGGPTEGLSADRGVSSDAGKVPAGEGGGSGSGKEAPAGGSGTGGVSAGGGGDGGFTAGASAGGGVSGSAGAGGGIGQGVAAGAASALPPRPLQPQLQVSRCLSLSACQGLIDEAVTAATVVDPDAGRAFGRGVRNASVTAVSAQGGAAASPAPVPARAPAPAPPAAGRKRKQGAAAAGGASAAAAPPARRAKKLEAAAAGKQPGERGAGEGGEEMDVNVDMELLQEGGEGAAAGGGMVVDDDEGAEVVEVEVEITAVKHPHHHHKQQQQQQLHHHHHHHQPGPKPRGRPPKLGPDGQRLRPPKPQPPAKTTAQPQAPRVRQTRGQQTQQAQQGHQAQQGQQGQQEAVGGGAGEDADAAAACGLLLLGAADRGGAADAGDGDEDKGEGVREAAQRRAHEGRGQLLGSGGGGSRRGAAAGQQQLGIPADSQQLGQAAAAATSSPRRSAHSTKVPDSGGGIGAAAAADGDERPRSRRRVAGGGDGVSAGAPAAPAAPAEPEGEPGERGSPPALAQLGRGARRGELGILLDVSVGFGAAEADGSERPRSRRRVAGAGAEGSTAAPVEPAEPEADGDTDEAARRGGSPPPPAGAAPAAPLVQHGRPTGSQKWFWGEETTAALLQGMQASGAHAWGEVVASTGHQMGGRTPRDCLDRWRTLAKAHQRDWSSTRIDLSAGTKAMVAALVDSGKWPKK